MIPIENGKGSINVGFINVPTDGSAHPHARTTRIVGGDQSSFRRQVRAAAIILLIVNIAVGRFTRQQRHAIINYALTIHDTAFISTNYVHLAQVSFQHYVVERLSSPTPATD